MTDRTKLGIVVLLAAALLGILGDILLRAMPWGLNVFVWSTALVTAVVILVRWRRVALNGSGRWLTAPVLLFAASLAWRDSPVLNALSLLALALSLALALLRAQAGQLLLAGVMEYLLSILLAAFNAAAGAIRLVAEDIQWKELSHEGWRKHSGPVLRGLAIALPLLLIFGALLAGADAVFSNIISRGFDWDIARTIDHAALIILIGWMVSGFLRGVLLGKEIAVTAGGRPQGWHLGITEIGIALGLLDVLFLSFVLVQFRYFFGGAARVQTIPGLTYAEYARSGFFELVSVAALVLPLLLAAHWFLRKEKPLEERIFRLLAGMMIVLLAVIMVSAFRRMYIYQQEYGLTELRVYTTAFMGWLVLVFGWFGLTVLRGKRERFAFGAVATGFSLVIGLLVVNPDNLIVSANLQHASSGREFDAGYLGRLSADAVPKVIDSMAGLEKEPRCILARVLLQRLNTQSDLDWRQWNWSRSEASRLIREHESSLRTITEACPYPAQKD
ncbi:MAG: DUF4173 domain-containing protein [Blastocatellia bacterium]|nr:DUF4173 domain-containing protein [Blastocatellia bacterium]